MVFKYASFDSYRLNCVIQAISIIYSCAVTIELRFSGQVCVWLMSLSNSLAYTFGKKKKQKQQHNRQSIYCIHIENKLQNFWCVWCMRTSHTGGDIKKTNMNGNKRTERRHTTPSTTTKTASTHKKKKQMIENEL